jgi:nucleoid-associated protein YgaU
MAELLELRIRRFNMYQTGKVYNFPVEDEQLLLRDKINYTSGLFDKSHTVKQNETIWGIAYEEYRDKVNNPSRYWWIIADANDIFNPFDLTDLVGKDIIIPSISNVALTT